MATRAEPPPAPADRGVRAADLRHDLEQRLSAGRFEEALRAAQSALAAAPEDPAIRAEYIRLHLALAAFWCDAGHDDSARAALEAILALQPDHAAARTLRQRLEAAAQTRSEQLAQIDELLRLELYDAALEPLRLLATRTEAVEAIAARRRQALLGVADDHYLARNFPEAFALYEQVLALEPAAPPAVHTRWALALALALSKMPAADNEDPDAAGRLLARSIDVLRKTNEPILGLMLAGLLAERGGHLLEAGRTYCEALGRRWDLPPVDQRRSVISELRREVIQRLRELYEVTPTQRRTGLWGVALSDAWKRRTTPHFDVYARNDLVAERIAAALEYHVPRLAAWLGLELAEQWTPRLEVRVHAQKEDMHTATGFDGITFAVSHARVQGDRIVSRKLEVFQEDPWLLSSTLPHELVHALIIEAYRGRGPALAIDEGIALQAEPPARRLMYRRRLPAEAPKPAELLSATAVPPDAEAFYAQTDALTAWLIDRLAALAAANQAGATASLDNPIPRLITWSPAQSEIWQRRFGFATEAEAAKNWAAWYAARRQPARIPLMILVPPSDEHLKGDQPTTTETAPLPRR